MNWLDVRGGFFGEKGRLWGGWENMVDTDICPRIKILLFFLFNEKQCNCVLLHIYIVGNVLQYQGGMQSMQSRQHTQNI